MNKEILKLAIPNIISNISIPLLSTVDTMLMGHLSALELGAVGISSMIFNFVYWNFGFLRMGTTGMTAQAFGRKDNFEISSVLQKSFFISITISVLLMLLMVPICSTSSSLMNVSLTQQEYVNTYFYTRIWAAPATLCLYALMGWFFGMQNARIPLLITIAVNITNIVLSSFFVLNLELGIKGVALGTVIAQYLGLCIAIILIAMKYKDYLKKIPLRLLLAWANIKDFLRINSDIFLRTICLSFVFAFMYSQASLKGELFLAANVVLLQFLNWMSYAIDGFSYAAESLVGKYYGAKDKEKTYRVIKLIFVWGFILAVLFTLIYWVFGEGIIRLFTDQIEVVNISKNMIIWVVVMPIIAFSCYLWDGIFIGLTASKAMRNTMLISLVFYLLAFFLLRDNLRVERIWFSLLVFLAARGIMQTFVFYRKGLSMT